MKTKKNVAEREWNGARQIKASFITLLMLLLLLLLSRRSAQQKEYI